MVNISYKEDSGLLRLPKTLYGVNTWYIVSLLIIITLIGSYLVLNFIGLLAEDTDSAMAISDGLGIFSTGIFLIVSLVGLTRSKNLNIRQGIIAFTLSSLLYFIAEITWATYNFVLSVEVPYPSMADIFYLSGSISFVAALYLVKKGLLNKPKFDLQMVAIMVVGSVLLAVILYIVTALSGSDIDLSTALDIAYPVLDFISLVLVINLLMVSMKRSVAEAQVILTAGVVITAASDIAFAFATKLNLYSGGSLLDFMFVIGYLLFAVSVWRYVALTREDIVKDRISKIGHRTNT